MSTGDDATQLRVPKSELGPGARRRLQAGRTEILVLNTGGVVYALLNRCPHHQAPLDSGPIGGTSEATLPGEMTYVMPGRVLRCPWHHYEYDLRTGRCLADPARLRVRTYRTHEDGDDYVVDLTGRPADVE